MMQKYGQVSATGGKVTRKYKKMATPEGCTAPLVMNFAFHYSS